MARIAGLAILVAGFGWGTGIAHAAVVTQLLGTAGYLALPGEVNRLVVARDGDTAVFRDAGTGLLVAGPGCLRQADRVVRCPATRTLNLQLGDGADVVLVSGAFHTRAFGGPGDDVIVSAGAADELFGGDGDDSLDGGAEGDLLDGGRGKDTADYSARSRRVVVTLDGRFNDGEEGEGDNVFATERVLGGQAGDVIQGDRGDNELHGGPGNDSLGGGGGQDLLDGGPGRDGINANDPSQESGGDGEAASGTEPAGAADAPDTVGCGEDHDRVFGEPGDEVDPDCEVVDRSGTLGFTARATAGAERPVLGRSVVVRPVSGVVLVVPPAPGADLSDPQPVPASPSVPLDDEERNIPVGSVVDTRFGTVEMTTAIDRGGTTQVGQFHSGPFQVFQEAVDGAVADLVLRGGKSFASCPEGQRGNGLIGRSAARRGGRGGGVRRLWSSAKGRFRTTGRFAAGTVRGTRWLTVDRCDGTLVRVTEGAVAVFDAVTRRTVVVRAGERYLARTPRR